MIRRAGNYLFAVCMLLTGGCILTATGLCLYEPEIEISPSQAALAGKLLLALIGLFFASALMANYPARRRF